MQTQQVPYTLKSGQRVMVPSDITEAELDQLESQASTTSGPSTPRLRATTPADRERDAARPPLGGSKRTVAGQMANVPGSLWNQITGVGEMVPPVVRGLKTVSTSLFGTPSERVTATQQSREMLGQLSALPGAMFEDLKQHYGSLERLQQTAYEDPARFVMDLAALGGVAGGLKNVLRSASAAPRAAGRSLMQSALKIAPEEAAQAGQGVAHRGAQALTERVGSTPGMRMKTKFRAVEKNLQDLGAKDTAAAQAASEAGVRISGEPIVAAGEALTAPGGRLYSSFESPEALSGAKRTVEGVRKKLELPGEQLSDAELAAQYQEAVRGIRGGEAQGVGGDITRSMPTSSGGGVRDFDPVELRQWLKNTEFVSGGEVPGSAEASRAMRMAGSEAYKAAVPGARDIFAEQSTQIPVQDILDRTLLASGREASARSPHLMVRGSGAHTFGIIPLMKSGVFDAGNALYRTGRAGQAMKPIDPALIRLALLGLMRPAPSHTKGPS